MMWIPKVANVADDHVEGTISRWSGVGDGFGAQIQSTRSTKPKRPLPFHQRIDNIKETLCFFLYLSSLSLLYQRIEISRKLITNWCVQQQKRLRIGGGRTWRRTIRSLGHGSDGWVKDGRGDTFQRLVDSLSLFSILLNALPRWTDRRDLLGSQDSKSFGQQMRMRPYHWLPAGCLHHICCMSKTKGPRIKDRPFPLHSSNFKRRKTDPKSKWDIKKNIRVDEVDGLGLELIGRVEIG